MRQTPPVALVLLPLVLAGCAWFSGSPAGSSSSSSSLSGSGASSFLVSSSLSSNPDITVAFPQPGDLVSSPLTVSGSAKGGWYFEASFPTKLLDANGNQIASGPAQAQGDWMTINFVPFQAVLTFGTPPTATGTLVLEKDNPSGEPQNAASVTIPVRFGP